jgi:predicted DNA-binding transcriptional regulator AlpA
MNPRELSAPPPAEPAVAATEVLTADEAAALLGVSRWTLYSEPRLLAHHGHSSGSFPRSYRPGEGDLLSTPAPRHLAGHRSVGDLGLEGIDPERNATPT